jgi:hypothetical protein
MKRQYAGNQSSARRNPFDVMDVPNPNDQEVQEFATGTKLEGTPDDENRHGRPRATAINTARSKEVGRAGGMVGADPTIPRDAADKWKRAQAEVKAAGDPIYLLFDWDNVGAEG